MRCIVVGVGAVGGYFGGRLAEAGAEVAYLARGRTLDVLKRSGLKISSPHGDLHLTDLEVAEDPAELAPADVVMLGVKSWQVPEIAGRLRPLLRPGGCVLPLQNGVDAPAQLMRELGEGAVLGGLCKILSQLEDRGHVRHLGGRPSVAFGELDDRESARVETLRQWLEKTGVKVEVPSSIQAAMWEKFLFICAVSGLGAVTRAPIGVLLESAETRSMLVACMEEIETVAKAREIPVAEDIVARTMGFLEALPPEATASMQRDIMDGRPSELEAQNGAVVRLGAEVSVPTPVNAMLYHLLLPQERAARA